MSIMTNIASLYTKQKTKKKTTSNYAKQCKIFVSPISYVFHKTNYVQGKHCI